MVLRLKTRESRSSPGLPRTGVFELAPSASGLFEREETLRHCLALLARNLGLPEPSSRTREIASPLLRVGLPRSGWKAAWEKSSAAFLRLALRLAAGGFVLASERDRAQARSRGLAILCGGRGR